MNQFKQITVEEITDNACKLIGKDWMLVTAKKGEQINTMTASWGGIGVMWGKNVAYIVIRPQRYTKEFVDANECFSLTFFSKDYKKQLGYLGSVSGRDEDKITNAGITVAYHNEIPYFSEGRLVLCCKKLFAAPMHAEEFLDSSLLEKWYPNNDLHTLYIAEITDVLQK